MDDPMIRLRLGWITGTRPSGAPDPKRGSLFYFSLEIDQFGVSDRVFQICASEPRMQAPQRS